MIVNSILTKSCARHEFREMLMKNGCQIKESTIANVLLCTIKCIAYTFSFLSVLAIVLTLFQKCFPCSLSFTSDGITYFLDSFKPFSVLFEITILLLTIVVALLTYRHSVAIEELKGIQDLRQIFSDADKIKINNLLERKDCDNDIQQKEKALRNEYEEKIANIYDYLGTLELLELYIEKGIISEDMFKEQFGYRVENVFASEFIRTEIEKNRSYWRVLYNLYDRINK